MSTAAHPLDSTRFSQVWLKQAQQDEQRTREARCLLEMALEDLEHEDPESAGTVIQRALVLRPSEVAIQEAYRRIEARWRQLYYGRQDWRDGYLTAKLSLQGRDLTTAAISFSSLEQQDPRLAPSFAEYIEAAEIGQGVQNQISALEGIAQIATARLEAGRRRAARDLCQRYLELSPGDQWLGQVARQCGLPVEIPMWGRVSLARIAEAETDVLADLSMLELSAKEPRAKAAHAAAASSGGGSYSVAIQRKNDSWDRARSTACAEAFLALCQECGDVLEGPRRAVADLLGKIEANRLSDAKLLCASAEDEFAGYAVFSDLSREIEARILCAGWNYCQEIMDSAAAEPDLSKRCVLLRKALTVAPDEPLFVREYELTRREVYFRLSPHSDSWSFTEIELQRAQERAQRHRKWLRSSAFVAGFLALAASLLFFWPHAGPPHHSPLPAQSRASVAAPPIAATLPIQVMSHVSFALFLDFKPLYRSEQGATHALNVPAGDHVFSIAHRGSLLHLFTKVRGSNHAPEVHPDGLSAIVISDGQMSLTGVKPHSLKLDGRQITGTHLPAVGAGAHVLLADSQLFAFTEAANQSLVLITATDPEKISQIREADAQREQATVAKRAKHLLASLSVKQSPHQSPAPAQLAAPPELGNVETHPVTLPEQAAGVSSLPVPPAMSGRLKSNEAERVVAVLRNYSEAWQAKDLAGIIALRPNLNKRAVREDLAGVSAISMKIRPTSLHIEGDRAAVECIHQVTQTFSDGVQKRSPEVRMTYELVRQNGVWLIDRTK